MDEKFFRSTHGIKHVLNQYERIHRVFIDNDLDSCQDIILCDSPHQRLLQIYEILLEHHCFDSDTIKTISSLQEKMGCNEEASPNM